MQIKDMFLKPIDREIDGVIKVGKDRKENCFQELDEYVVTTDLEKYMLQFFEAYLNSYFSETDKIGVWISGFFGSGKSHFLKILSYILQNKLVKDEQGNEYTAASFFMDETKVTNPKLRSIIERVANESASADVILFNIDSKSSTYSQTNKDAIKDVFMKVFNDHLGYCGSIPFLADFERKIDSEGRFEEFKDRFQEINGNTWESQRDDFYFIQDEVIQTVTDLGIMSESEAKNWAENAQASYSLSIDKFADIVKKYCKKKGNNRHVLFMVDEIGQYISDDSKLMLNLQTVTEDLGVACEGKAWIIVTSQQDIDSITRVMGQDFSKIQGRFDTRISLTSANVDEVIRKRILKKKESAEPVLKQLYAEVEPTIKNIVTFSDGTPNMPLYANADEFVEVYPFIPYQFDLLGSILTSIRQFSSSGKHLADGERTMLAMSKEGAYYYSTKTDGTLIPLYFFYDALERWIDHQYRNVIEKAKKNPHFEPFDVDILKVLFLTKHINNFVRDIENITTLVLTSVDEDRITLGKRVEKALSVLCDQGVAQKNGNDYIFLTNEEQEVENYIRNIHVDPKDIVTYIAQIVFEEVAVFPNAKYKYNNRYQFSFNQSIDERPYRTNPSANIGLHILTAYSGQKDDMALGMLAFTEKSVVVRMSDEFSYLREIEEMKKIESFLHDPNAANLTNYDVISANKRKERAEKVKRISEYIRLSMENSLIYVQNNKLSTKSKDVVARISEAFQKLVESRYHKLQAMKSQPTAEDILEVLKATKISMTDLGMMEDPDSEALNELCNDINSLYKVGAQYSIKRALDEFSKDPYGYTEEDIEFLIAKLYRKGRISLKMNSVTYTPASITPDEAFKYITKKEYREKVLMDIKVNPPAQHVKALKDVIKEFLEKSISSDDSDTLMRDYRSYAEVKRTNLNESLMDYSVNSRLPGKTVIEKAIHLIDETLKLTDPISFYKKIFELCDDFLDIHDDLTELASFLSGPRKDKFLKAIRTLDIYENSKNFIPDAEVKKCAADMKSIISMEKPFGKIPELEKLDTQLMDAISKLLDDGVKVFEPGVYEDWRTAKGAIPEERPYKERVVNSIDRRFNALVEKLKSSTDIAAINAIPAESSALLENCLAEIQKEETEYQNVIKKNPPAGDTPVTPPKKIVTKKNIQIKTLVNLPTYSIKTEDDIDKLVEDLRKALKEKLEDNTIIKLM